MVVRHMCDYPLCVKPLHLEIGTDQDNYNDRKNRRILLKSLAEKVGKGATIRELRAICDLSQSELRWIKTSVTFWKRWCPDLPHMEEVPCGLLFSAAERREPETSDHFGDAIAAAFDRHEISERDRRIVMEHFQSMRFGGPPKENFGISRQRKHQITMKVIEALKCDEELRAEFCRNN